MTFKIHIEDDREHATYDITLFETKQLTNLESLNTLSYNLLQF